MFVTFCNKWTEVKTQRYRNTDNFSGRKPTRRTFSYMICLFESSTCFEQLCAHPEVENCMNTTSGIITLSVAVRYAGQDGTIPSWPEYRTATNTEWLYQMHLQLSPWERAHSCSKHVEDSNKHIIE